METHCVSCKKSTANKLNVRKNVPNGLMLLSNCAICDKKSTSQLLLKTKGSTNLMIFK